MTDMPFGMLGMAFGVGTSYGAPSSLGVPPVGIRWQLAIKIAEQIGVGLRCVAP